MHTPAWAVLPDARTASIGLEERWVGERVGKAARVDCGGNAHAVTRTQHDTTRDGQE